MRCLWTPCSLMMLRSPRAGRRKMCGVEGVAGADLVIEQGVEEGVAAAAAEGEGSDKKISREPTIE
jgi:hypothetical protein